MPKDKTEKKDKAETKKVKTYVVAKGRALSCLKGIRTEGQVVLPAHISEEDATKPVNFEKLIAAKVIVEK